MSGAGLRAAALALGVGCAAGVGGCGGSRPALPAAVRALQRQARPIGRGPRFQSPVRGHVLGPCRAGLGRRRAAHLEVFAENRVVLIPAGIGARAPLVRDAGRISAARCYGALVTVDPTGVVLWRPGSHLRLAAVFAGWGTTLSATALAGFTAPRGTRVRAYVDGRPETGAPGQIPLQPGAEIVLEVGPHVPPHRRYAFPPGT